MYSVSKHIENGLVRKTIKTYEYTKDKECIIIIMQAYEQLLKKYSYIYGVKDEDLESELLLALVKGMKIFRVKDEVFLTSYNELKNKVNLQRG